MKPRTTPLTSALCFGAPLMTAALLAQGPLGPPGPPAPTMKRLDAVDPGRPLDPASFGTAGVVIDRPGYYYLTGNVTTVPATQFAISVLATQVTIDLRGFAFIAAGGTGAGSSGSAIVVSVTASDVAVRNGSIRGAWWAGLHSSSRQCAAEDLRVSGTVAYGIRLDDRAQISRCRVDGMSAAGFVTNAGIFVEDDSLVKECHVALCDGNGIQAATGASVLDCIAHGNTLDGITVGNGGLVSRCASSLNAGKGLELAANGTVTDCAVYDNGGSGITGTTGGNVTNTAAFSSGDRGFSFTSAVFSNSVAARSTNAGLVVIRASSISQCVAAANGGDGFFGDSFSGMDDAVVLEGCTAYSNGQTAANINADGFEFDAAFKLVRCVTVGNRGWGLRVTGNVSDSATVDGNLLISNDAGGIIFPSNFGAPLIIRNGVGVGNITPAPSASSYDLLAPFGTAQSDQPFINF